MQYNQPELVVLSQKFHVRYRAGLPHPTTKARVTLNCPKSLLNLLFTHSVYLRWHLLVRCFVMRLSVVVALPAVRIRVGREWTHISPGKAEPFRAALDGFRKPECLSRQQVFNFLNSARRLQMRSSSCPWKLVRNEHDIIGNKAAIGADLVHWRGNTFWQGVLMADEIHLTKMSNDRLTGSRLSKSASSLLNNLHSSCRRCLNYFTTQTARSLTLEELSWGTTYCQLLLYWPWHQHQREMSNR